MGQVTITFLEFCEAVIRVLSVLFCTHLLENQNSTAQHDSCRSAFNFCVAVWICRTLTPGPQRLDSKCQFRKMLFSGEGQIFQSVISLQISIIGVPVVAQWLTRNHEVVGSAPALAQWVNDPALP